MTQKIDIECGGSGNNSGQTAHTPTHHFTLSTVINVSVNGQTQKSLDILPSPSQQQCSTKSNDQQDLHNHSSLPTTNLSSIPLIPYSELNLSLYLKDIDFTTFDMLSLPSCPNPQDYLTVDGLLTFLMSDKNLSNEFNRYHQLRQTSQQYPMQQMYNYPRTQPYRHPYQVNKTNLFFENSNNLFFFFDIAISNVSII